MFLEKLDSKTNKNKILLHKLDRYCVVGQYKLKLARKNR